MPRLAPLAFALLATFAWAAPHDTIVTVPKTVTKDTAGLCPFIRTPMPDIDMNEGETFGPVNLNQYGAAGDVRITSSPVHGDIAPTIVLGGTAVADDTLTTTDKNNATYQIGASAVAVDGDITFTYGNAVAGCSDAVDTVHVTIHDSGTPSGEVAIPEGPTANTYFVDIVAGLDTNNGTKATPGSGGNGPWKNISKVNGFAMPVGADVFFLQGTAHKAVLTIDWDGTSSDYVNVGTYYLNGNQPFELRPDNPTAWPTAYTYNNGARAVFNGNCPIFTNWQDPICFYGNAGSAYDDTVAPITYQNRPSQAIPSSMYEGLIAINASYVNLHDVKVYGSSGVGIKVNRISYSVPGRHHINIERVFTDVTFVEGVKAEIADYVTLRNSVIRHGSARDNPENPSANGSIMYFTNAKAAFPNHYLIEGNDISASGAEGLDIFYNPISMIIRGNRIGGMDTSRPCIYGDNGQHIVIEYNVCYSGNGLGQVDNRNRGMAFTFEQGGSVNDHRNQIDFIIRGNMFAGTSHMVEFGDDVHIDNGQRRFAAKVYGNIGMELSGAPFKMGSVFAVGSEGIDIRDNIIMTNSATLCDTTKLTGWIGGGTISFGYNLWNVQPPAICRGTGDITGTVLVNGTNFAAKTWTTNPATPADFILQGGSPGQNVSGAGSAMQVTVLSAGDYPQSGSITVPCATFDLKGMAIDATCQLRNVTTPDLGANEL